jgi:hypothetical protein
MSCAELWCLLPLKREEQRMRTRTFSFSRSLFDCSRLRLAHSSDFTNCCHQPVYNLSAATLNYRNLHAVRPYLLANLYREDA